MTPGILCTGGAIGTGLVIGSGSGLARAGPVGLLIGSVTLSLLLPHLLRHRHHRTNARLPLL